MKYKLVEITLDGIQIKSEEIFHKLCKALEIIEENCGIYETRFTIKDIFFCPWINIDNCNKTHMEKLIISMINRLK
jgi:hypothetical protein